MGLTLQHISEIFPQHNKIVKHTGAPGYIHRGALFVPEIPVNCRSDGERFRNLIFQFRWSIADNLGRDSPIHWVTRKIYAPIADGRISAGSNLGRGK